MTMGMQALYLVEAKTRQILLEQDLQELVDRIEQIGGAVKAHFELTLLDFRTRFNGMKEDLVLLHETDENDWGEFCNELDASMLKLKHDIGAAKAEVEEQKAFA